MQNGPFRFASQFSVGRIVSRRSETFRFVSQEGMLRLGWKGTSTHADAAVDQWRQIRPGVWFPVSAAVTVYNTTALKQENTQKLQYREQYTVERVSLEPDHEIAFFREFDAEKGTAEATQ